MKTKIDDSKTRLSKIDGVLDKLDRLEPIQIFSGQGLSDELIDLKKASSTDFIKGLLSIIKAKNKFDYVMIYNAARCEVKFLDEIALDKDDRKTSRKMRAGLLGMGDDLQVTDMQGETNLVPIFLRENAIKSVDGMMPDRVVMDMVKLLVEQDKKVLLLIDDAADFVYPDRGNGNGIPVSQNRLLNESLLTDLAHELRASGHSKIILVDRQNKLSGVLGDVADFQCVNFPTEAESRQAISTEVAAESLDEVIELARGLTIRRVRRVLAEVTDQSQLLTTLKKFKEDEVARISKGTVKCNMDKYTREQVAMGEEESVFWEELAVTMRDSKQMELLPQGVLLVGPPGTGKSVRARYLASNMSVPCLELNNISSSGLRGMKEDRIRSAFEAAISVKPCVLFIDEIDKYLPRTEGSRSGGSENDDSEVTAYIQRMLDSKEMNGVVIVGAANDPDQMNEAMLRNGRFGLRVGVLSPKTLSEKQKVFCAVLRQIDALGEVEIDNDLVKLIISRDNLAQATGADYKELIRRSSVKMRSSGGENFWKFLAKEAAAFKVRANSRIDEMEEKAINMHTAGFSLIGDSSEVQNDTVDEVALLAEMKLDLKKKEKGLKKVEKGLEKKEAAVQKKEAELTEREATVTTEIESRSAAERKKLQREYDRKTAQVEQEAEIQRRELQAQFEKKRVELEAEAVRRQAVAVQSMAVSSKPGLSSTARSGGSADTIAQSMKPKLKSRLATASELKVRGLDPKLLGVVHIEEERFDVDPGYGYEDEDEDEDEDPDSENMSLSEQELRLRIRRQEMLDDQEETRQNSLHREKLMRENVHRQVFDFMRASISHEMKEASERFLVRSLGSAGNRFYFNSSQFAEIFVKMRAARLVPKAPDRPHLYLDAHLVNIFKNPEFVSDHPLKVLQKHIGFYMRSPADDTSHDNNINYLYYNKETRDQLAIMYAMAMAAWISSNCEEPEQLNYAIELCKSRKDKEGLVNYIVALVSHILQRKYGINIHSKWDDVVMSVVAVYVLEQNGDIGKLNLERKRTVA